MRFATLASLVQQQEQATRPLLQQVQATRLLLQVGQLLCQQVLLLLLLQRLLVRMLLSLQEGV
jgi:hypothetical protein